MPLPKPRSGEEKDTWLSRCMWNPKMNEEFPKRDRRFAVCQSQWRRHMDGKTEHHHTHNSNMMDSEPSWASVEKESLPREAFAEIGEPDKKSTWGFPHHFISEGSEKDDNGIWTNGTMFLHKGGLNAAWAAAQGARSGQEASQAVKDHLQAHRKAIGIADEDEKAMKSLSQVYKHRFKHMSEGNGLDPKDIRRELFTPDAKLWAKRLHDTNDADPGYLEGYAAYFNNIDHGDEVIRPGSFAKTMERITAKKVPLMGRHFADGGGGFDVIGVLTSGNEEPEKGLAIKADFGSDDYSQVFRSKVADGLIRGLSIGYIPVRYGFLRQDNKMILEHFEIKLMEVTVTPFPMNELAEITSAKSFQNGLERILRYAKRMNLDLKETPAMTGRLPEDLVGSKDAIAALLGELGRLTGRTLDLQSEGKPKVDAGGCPLTDTDLHLIQLGIEQAETDLLSIGG